MKIHPATENHYAWIEITPEDEERIAKTGTEFFLDQCYPQQRHFIDADELLKRLEKEEDEQDEGRNIYEAGIASGLRQAQYIVEDMMGEK
jgi:hypothetical protein